MSETALVISPAAILISETPLSVLSYNLLIKRDKYTEESIPAIEVKKAVFKPLNNKGILSSKSAVSKNINPIVIPPNVPNTPNVDRIDGICSIHLLLATNCLLRDIFLIYNVAYIAANAIAATNTHVTIFKI